VMRSDDGGGTWTRPGDGHHGLITAEGEYHTAPMPVVQHDGRLWRACEDAMGGTAWGERYRARMLSIPLDADLLEAANWNLSEPLARDPRWLDGKFGGWLEGNAVVTPEGEMVNILRVACDEGGKAAMVHVGKDGKTVRFDPAADFIDFPGGAKKFVIRYDRQTQAYWALSNPVMPCHTGQAKAASIRNTLALMKSTDLRNWEIRCLLIYHPDIRSHGFQYPDWLFEGDDIIAAVRAAFDDGLGGAHNAHDANFLTFHRFANFRNLAMADSVVDPKTLEAGPAVRIETPRLTIEGQRFEPGTLADGELAYSNRQYVWKDVPARLAGWHYTRTAGGKSAAITVTATEDATLTAATAITSTSPPAGWTATGETFRYTDQKQTTVSVLERKVRAGQSLRVFQGNWTGTLILVPPQSPTTPRPQASPSADARSLNVLFIAADDLRVELGCYGDTLVKTPNFDRLAARGMRFTRAYSQQALCNPSRASLMTGLRPDTLGIWDLPTHFREVRPDAVTLPELFKQKGYFTQNIGKIYHNWRQAIQGDPQSWSVPAVMHFATHDSDAAQVRGDLPPNLSTTLRTECRDVPDEAYFDGRIAAEAVKALEQLQDRPFFLAVGFWKPHLPFNAPKRYWDLYDPAAVDLPANPDPPVDVPAIALHNSQELLGKKGSVLTDDQVRQLRRGYYAGISYLDAQVGKVLDQLDRLRLTDRTIVVFWSDHGFHLGEHRLWCKTSNFELDARVPLIIAAPSPEHPGAESESLVELVDLYPTLAELCGLPRPEGLDGTSLVPVLDDPAASVRDTACTQHPRPAYYQGEPEAMGCSVRTPDRRYTEWRDFRTGKVLATELYDHQSDPRETRNLAASPDRKEEVKELAAKLTSVFTRKP
ncbi:MAG: sulfatase, partial [Thermoguttaceae bacterium]